MPEQARREAADVTAGAIDRVRELDLDTDRIWAERDRIVTDMRELARQLLELADDASERFPPSEEPDSGLGLPPTNGQVPDEEVDGISFEPPPIGFDEQS